MISHVGLSELSHTTWYSSYCAITYDPSTKRSQTRNTSNGNKYMFDYWYSIIMAHMKKKKKKSIVTKTSHLPENYNFYLDTMTGTNSSNDRLV